MINEDRIKQMKIGEVRKLLEALRRHPTDSGKAMVLCREVVSVLPSEDWVTVRELSSMVGALQLNLQDSHRGEAGFLTGVLAALGETLATFETAAQQAEDDKIRLTLVARHAALLDQLEAPQQPSELAQTLKKSLPQVSRTLADLCHAGLVEELERTGDQDRRSRRYMRTALAEILSEKTSPVPAAAPASKHKQPALAR
jgi:DNA-binding MarR family transcriptional regulator